MTRDPDHCAVYTDVASLAPYCTCGWPVTEGGTKFVWHPGDKTLLQHLEEVGAL